MTADWRGLPDFLVLGAQRCGTSSLFRYLGGHPAIAPPLRKETEFFTRRYNNGLQWYQSHFTLGHRRMRFEATPDYLFYPPTPRRVAQTLPDARFVVLLRDPVDRAWSHYGHMVRLGFEKLAFERALATESERIESDLNQAITKADHYAQPLLWFSYASRGLYAEQLRRWFSIFPREQFLILWSDDLFARTPETFGRLLDFLSLPQWAPRSFDNFSYPNGPRPVTERAPTRAVESLRAKFREPDDDLASLLGEVPPWRR